MGEYTNGTGRCPTGAANAQAITDLGRRLNVVETKTDRLEERTEQHFAALLGKLDDALARREERKAVLSAGSAVAVAIIAALATVLAQWLPALAGH